MQARKKTVHPRHFNIHLLVQQGAPPPGMLYYQQKVTKTAGTSVMSNKHEVPSKVVTKVGSGLRVQTLSPSPGGVSTVLITPFVPRTLTNTTSPMRSPGRDQVMKPSAPLIKGTYADVHKFNSKISGRALKERLKLAK